MTMQDQDFHSIAAIFAKATGLDAKAIAKAYADDKELLAYEFNKNEKLDYLKKCGGTFICVGVPVLFASPVASALLMLTGASFALPAQKRQNAVFARIKKSVDDITPKL